MIGWRSVGFIVFLIVALLTCAALFGCSNQASHVPNSIPAVGSSIQKADAHVQSANIDVIAAYPYTDKTGLVVLRLASGEHVATRTELANAARELNQVQFQRDTLVKDNAGLTAENARLLHSWGHRLQVAVNKVFWTLVTLAILHAALASAAFLLPLVFPAAAVAVPFLSLGAKIINPLGWFTVLAGHAQTRYLMVASAKPGVN